MKSRQTERRRLPKQIARLGPSQGQANLASAGCVTLRYVYSPARWLIVGTQTSNARWLLLSHKFTFGSLVVRYSQAFSILGPCLNWNIEHVYMYFIGVRQCPTKEHAGAKDPWRHSSSVTVARPVHVFESCSLWCATKETALFVLFDYLQWSKATYIIFLSTN